MGGKPQVCEGSFDKVFDDSDEVDWRAYYECTVCGRFFQLLPSLRLPRHYFAPPETKPPFMGPHSRFVRRRG